MPTLSTNADNLTFTAPNQQWIIQTGVVVGSPNVLSAVIMPFAGDNLVNNGTVFMPAGVPIGGVAVILTNAAVGATVTNSKTGSIAGLSGIQAVAGSVHVHNDGSIVGFAGIGIDYGQGKGAALENSGYIHGETVAVRGTLLDGFTMTNSGLIDSGGDAVVLLATGQIDITNSGTIRAGNGSSAIIADGKGATVNLVNTGVINGPVELSPGADIFDSRGGVAKGPVHGYDGNDSLTGGGGANALHGEDGQDVISGRGGGDMLIGGADGDTIKGGRGGDDFVYTDVSDSTGKSASTRDTLLDFGNDDIIDLRAIDAKIGNGNQKFDFIGTDDFTGKKGQLRYEVDNGNAVVQADVTGDGKADMTILVIDVNKLAANDFNL
jgi:hypothetical protein